MSTNLSIDAKDGLVSISWAGHQDDATWLEVISFWRQFAIDSNLSNEIQIPVGEFFTKRNWFRIYWLDKGRQITQGQGLSQAIEYATQQDRIFEKLSNSGYSDELVPEIEQNSISLKRPLTTSQKTNISSMLKAPNGANFSVPGAGKTSTQLALFAILKQRREISRMLVICPKSSFEAWMEEPEAIFTNPTQTSIFNSGLIPSQTEVLLVNFEKLESTARRKTLLSWASQPGGTLLVIDEAHRVKSGSRGVRWRACVQLASYADRVDLLSGTPMPQSYEDLRNLLSISWRAIPRHKLDDDRLSKFTAGGVFVRTTKSQLGLPGVNIHRVELPMGKYQEEIYGAISRRYFGLLSLKSNDQIQLMQKGRAVMSLIAAATNPALVADKTRDELLRSLGWPPKEVGDGDLMATLRNYLAHEIPPKYEWILRYLSQPETNGRKTLIWSSFVGNIEILNRYLKKFNPAVIHGSVSVEDRARELQRFRLDPECRVLITNPQTLGEGVSLHKTAHEAIFIDRTYNAAQYLQALDRIHRLGIDKNQETNVYLLETRGSIDSRVGLRLGKKITTLSEMLNDAGLVRISLPASDESQDLGELMGFDQNDLNDLLMHLGK